MGDIRITGAALDAKLSSETARSSVKLTYTPVSGVSEDEDDEEDEVEAESIVLCSLTPGKVSLSFFTSTGSYSVSFIQIEQSPLNLIVVEDVELTFEVVGEKCVSKLMLIRRYLIIMQCHPPQWQLYSYVLFLIHITEYGQANTILTVQNSDFPADSDEEDSEFDEEDAYHLDEVSSDVLEEADDLMDEDSDSEEGA